MTIIIISAATFFVNKGLSLSLCPSPIATVCQSVGRFKPALSEMS